MKYLKLFEELSNTYKVQDFIDIPYWRYRNSQVDTIMKVEYLDNDKEGRKWNSDYRFTFLRLNDGSFFEMIDKNNFLYQILNLDVPEKILRPATDGEIEPFKERELAKKFNI